MGWLAALAVVGVLAIGAMVAREPASTQPQPDFDETAVAEGEQLFVASCSVCHGADLQGTPVGPPFLNTIYAPNHHGDEAFQRAAAEGVAPHHWDFGPMPPVPGLTRDDVEKIVAYVRVEQQTAGIFRDPTHP